ncbi:uncharacterized protein LOC116253569 [Nymphaea colorata]|nr:uncharacterized protein LOC116253569 [Nymphaea colorata]
MDRSMKSRVFVILSLCSLLLQIQGERQTGGVLFLDSPEHRYLRSGRPTKDDDSASSMTSSDVAATISVLLGFAPPASLPVTSYAKLDKILVPNPFNKPDAVMVLEVGGLEDSSLLLGHGKIQKDGVAIYNSKVLVDSGRSELELSDEDDVALVRLDEPLGFECNAACIDQELHGVASLLEGSYVGSHEPLEGVLTFPLNDGTSFNLHVSRATDREFAVDLVSLVRNIKWAIEMHGDLSAATMKRELLIGRFTGIEALQEKYGADMANQGMELVLTASRRLFDLLHTHYQGHVVGVVIAGAKSASESGKVLDVKYSARVSRWLEEAGSSNTTAIDEVQLVRTSLAWITGIILLISTLIGVYYLLYMPFTRDTLLYSNVKFD